MKRFFILLSIIVFLISSCSDKPNDESAYKPEYEPDSEIVMRKDTKNIEEDFDKAARKDESEKQMDMIRKLYDIENINQDKEVISDLMKQPELIPFKPVLDGKMDYISENDIVILLDNYVFATFTDSYISGCMLMKYTKEETGIKWEVVNEYISE
ncbi:MAG: hypothetical protein ABF289_20415 [Clostridiales bacterium]